MQVHAVRSCCHTDIIIIIIIIIIMIIIMQNLYSAIMPLGSYRGYVGNVGKVP